MGKGKKTCSEQTGTVRGALLTLANNANAPDQLQVDVIIPLFPKGIKKVKQIICGGTAGRWHKSIHVRAKPGPTRGLGERFLTWKQPSVPLPLP